MPSDQQKAAEEQGVNVLLNIIQRVDETVPDEYKAKLRELFYEHRTAFSMNKNDLGRASIL